MGGENPHLSEGAPADGFQHREVLERRHRRGSGYLRRYVRRRFAVFGDRLALSAGLLASRTAKVFRAVAASGHARVPLSPREQVVHLVRVLWTVSLSSGARTTAATESTERHLLAPPYVVRKRMRELTAYICTCVMDAHAVRKRLSSGRFFPDNSARAEALKEEGNVYFKRRELKEALECYSKVVNTRNYRKHANYCRQPFFPPGLPQENKQQFFPNSLAIWNSPNIALLLTCLPMN